MSSDYQNIKVWRTTLNKLRLIYALKGEKMVEIVDRLVTVELEKLQKSVATNSSPDIER